MINNEVVRLFTLSKHEKTSVHNRDNWIYDLECKDESPSPPSTPQIYEIHPTYLSDIASISSDAHVPPRRDYTTEIYNFQTSVAQVRG